MAREERLAQVFVELADTLVDEFDIVDFLGTLAEVSVELLSVDAAGLMLADMRGDLQVIASSDDQVLLVELFELQRREGPSLDCFRTGRSLVNVTLPDDRWPRASQAALDAGYRTCHALPLRLRNDVIGAMNMFCADPTPMPDVDMTLGRALGDIATIGLLQERAIHDRVVMV